MTPGEALRALHGAGRLAQPWLAGMRTTRPHWRAYAREGGLAGAGEPAGYVADWEALFGGSYPVQRQPDTTDPATVGCLAALAREALGRPRMTCTPYSVGDGWGISGAPHTIVVEMHPTEGEAWAAALVALAGALP